MLEITLHLRTDEEVDLAAATLKKLFALRAMQPEDPKTHVHIEMPLTPAQPVAVPEPDVTVEPELTPAPVLRARRFPPPAVTLEQVRARLAQLNEAGKMDASKALIQSFGAKKLTDIPADRYGELLEKASGL